MASRKYPFVTDYFYHIFNRGVNHVSIFNDKTDNIRFINLLKFYNSVEYPIRFSKFMLLSLDQRKEIWNRINKSQKYLDIISYSLMPNHFHLLTKQNIDKGITIFLSNLQNSYTKYFNTKYSREGHLFQGPFKAIKIDSEEQLLHVSRYIHLNPYSSGIVRNFTDLNNYEWASFPEYISNLPFEICKKEIVLSKFRDKQSYKDFVYDNADYQKRFEEIKHLVAE